MKQAITFNTIMEALIPQEKPLVPGCQKKIMIILLFCEKAKPGTEDSMISQLL